MAHTIDVTIDVNKLLRDFNITKHDLFIARLCELLHADEETATDWALCKIAAYRGVSEVDVMVEMTDLES
jgi:hypothetical protein